MSTLGIKNEASQLIVNFLNANVPKSDAHNIESELKKDFVLAKTRSKEQKAKKPIRKKSKILTRKEKRALGFFGIPRNSVQYRDMLEVNAVWSEYITEVLELSTPVPEFGSKHWEQFTQTLYKADLHGSMLQVVRSKCPSYIGKKGICIMDTKNTFKIVSINNIITTIPKRECVFELHIKDKKICILGKYMCARPAERSTKKVKNSIHPDL